MIDNLILYVGAVLFTTNIEMAPTQSIVVVFLVETLYHAILVGAYGATIGKYVVGIKVTHHDGGHANYVQAAVRHLVSYVSLLLFFIGYIMVAFRNDKRALHDLAAETIVVNRN